MKKEKIIIINESEAVFIGNDITFDASCIVPNLQNSIKLKQLNKANKEITNKVNYFLYYNQGKEKEILEIEVPLNCEEIIAGLDDITKATIKTKNKNTKHIKKVIFASLAAAATIATIATIKDFHEKQKNIYETYGYDLEAMEDRLETNKTSQSEDYQSGWDAATSDLETNNNPMAVVIKSGDTLYDISLQYNVPVENIKMYNMKEDNNIYPGEIIWLESNMLMNENGNIEFKQLPDEIVIEAEEYANQINKVRY